MITIRSLLNNLFERINEFLYHERLTLYLIELGGNEAVDLHAEVSSKLTHVLLGHHHLIKFI